MDELKPCPFCGGKAAVNTIRYAADSETAKLNGQTLFYGVNCISCGTNNLGLVGHKTEESAIAAWNRRATDGQRDSARGVPTFTCKHVSVSEGYGGKLLVTMLADAIEPAPHYAVQPINPAAVRAAPTPQDGDIPTDSIDRLTREKAAHIIARDGFVVSGVVLTKPNGSVCIVDKSAVRWLTGDELFRVMHPDAPPDGDAGRMRKLLAKARDYLRCVEEQSMSRNNAEQLAAELGEEIDAAMAASKGEGA